MNPPNLSLTTWWFLYLAANVVFVAFVMPLWPTRAQRLKVLLMPPASALFGLAISAAKHMTAAEVLPIGTAALIALPLATVGRRREIRQKAADMQANGRRKENEWSLATNFQFVVVVASVAMCGVWLSLAGRY